MDNDASFLELCQGARQKFLDSHQAKKDCPFIPLYQRVGYRTGTIVRLIRAQHSPEEAEEIGFAIFGNPRQGGQSDEA